MEIKDDNGKIENISTDVILSFFGLIMKLGPIAEWGLNMDKKTISVNPENFETTKKEYLHQVIFVAIQTKA